MKKFAVSAIALTSLAALAWWGYQSQRGGDGPSWLNPGKEIASPAPGSGGSGTPARLVEASGAEGGAGKGAPGDGQPGAQGAAQKGAAATGSGGQRGPVGVEVARAEKVALSEDLQAVGNLRANESVMLKPEIPGRIVSLGFVDAARVSAGVLLVQLDPSVLAAQVEQSRAELALARASYERTEDLAKRNFVSGSARDQAAATLKVQEARLQLAEAQLAKTRIVAPFAGVLGLRNVSIGDFVKDGADLVMIEDVSSMKVDLRLPERYAGDLRKGQAIEVSVDSFPGRTFAARLEAIDVQIDANGRSLLARGRLSNPDGALRSGMFAKVRVVIKEKPAAVVIPEEAILPVGSDVFVYRIDAGKAMRVKVKTGIRRDGRVEIVEGVKAGDLVVTAGQLRLPRDAMEVRVIDPARQRADGGGGGGGAQQGGKGGPVAQGTPDAPGKAPPQGKAGVAGGG
ncbi:MAG: efflux RND transporter periplasmic adaptor subunit [Burkholderiaceae bacterium]|nr:efflux RND transporter periplasmic adaptor subunit [Burkholderiaceae bacterium]